MLQLYKGLIQSNVTIVQKTNSIQCYNCTTALFGAQKLRF